MSINSEMIGSIKPYLIEEGSPLAIGPQQESKRPHDTMTTFRTKVGRAVAASLLIASSGLAAFSVEEATHPATAYADVLGYPYPTDTEAPCKFGAGGGTSCTDPTPTSKTHTNEGSYNWGIFDSNNVFHPYRGAGGYEYRNCTDYVAWKLASLGVLASKVNGLGNGGQWYDNAPASERTTTPKAWDAAVVPSTTSNPAGHVAFVESVNSVDPANAGNDNITVSEYNHSTHGDGDTRTGKASDMGFTEYVDFGVHPTPPPPPPVVTNKYYLNNNFDGLADIVTTYGDPGIDAIVGDWDGNGTDTLAVRYGNTYYFNNGFDGTADFTETFGDPNIDVVVGDWDGNGTDTIGVRYGHTYYLDNNFDGVADVVTSYGSDSSQVMAGDWNGDGIDTLGIRDGNTFYLNNNFDGTADITRSYGDPNIPFVVGDWNGDGLDTLGVRYGNTYYLDNGFDGVADVVTSYGDSNDQPVAGDWTGKGYDTLGIREVD